MSYSHSVPISLSLRNTENVTCKSDLFVNIFIDSGIQGAELLCFLRF